MSQPVSVVASGVVAAGVPATAKVTANARVRAAAGPVSVLTDVVQFPGPPTVGNWLAGSTRVLVGGVFVVHQSATGTAVIPPPAGPSTAPMTVVQGDARVQAQ